MPKVKNSVSKRSPEASHERSPKVLPTAPENSPAVPIRINKAIARAGICSRRGADELVARGAVQVNGQVAREPGLMLEPSDELVVEGRRVEFMTLGTAAKNFIYIMMHKPVQVVCTAHDPENRTTVLDLLAAGNQLASGRRVYPVGRLDYFSEGLLLLTDDGALAERLTHPRYHVPKRYELVVRTKLAVPESVLDKMRAGMKLAEGEKLAPVEVRRLNFFTDPTGESRNREYLELTLHQGVNRQIRRMCRDLKLTVLRLLRVAQGPLKLGALAPGQSRELTATELAELRALVDL